VILLFCKERGALVPIHRRLWLQFELAKGAIQASVGYGVFADLGTKILLVSTAHGSGVAVNSKTKKETFMKMFSAGGGLGVGVKDYRVIFAFENDAAMARFWIRVGKVRPKPTPQPKRKRVGEHMPEQPTLTKVYGPTRSLRRVSPSTQRYRARSTPRTTISTTPKRNSIIRVSRPWREIGIPINCVFYLVAVDPEADLDLLRP
jgi:hypothetical protein